MAKTYIGIVDDHKILRDGLKLMFLCEPSYQILFEADNIIQLLDCLNRDIPDILILDLNLPGTNGLDIIESLKVKYQDMRILILSANYDEFSILSSIEKGVSGYVSKDADSDELMQAINTIASGDEYFGETVSRIVYLSFLKSSKATTFSVSDPNQTFLSDREVEVLKCFAEGMSYKQTADYLNISPRTVETHRMSIMHKLGLENIVQLVKFAIKNGIVSL